MPQHEIDEAKALQQLDPRTRDASGIPTAFGYAIGKGGTSASDKNSQLNHVGRAIGQEMVNAQIRGTKIADTLGINATSASTLKQEVKAAQTAPDPIGPV